MNQRKFLVTVAVLSLLTGCCLAFFGYALFSKGGWLHRMRPASQAAEEFMQALKMADYDVAFALCNPALQKELIDAAHLRMQFESHELQFTDWELTMLETSAEQVEFTASVSFEAGKTGNLRLFLLLYADGWKVARYHLTYN